jgi:phosphatidate cytidylyltransferase
MIKQRLLSSAVIISLLAGVLHLDMHHPLMGVGGLWLMPLLLGLALLATAELVDMLNVDSMSIRKRHVMLAVALVHVLTFVPALLDAFGGGYPADCAVGRLGWAPIGAVLGISWLWVVEMKHYEEPGGGVVTRLGASSLVILYTGVALSFLTSLRTFPFSGEASSAWGMVALLSIVIVTKCGDSGAYFMGKTFGKHKMAPRLSPGKTMEGACGAFLAGMAAAVVVGNWIAPALVQMGQGDIVVATGPIWAWAIYGALVTATGMFGDLAESLIKRDMQQKDSSSWLPGLGGVLDILDSITLSAVPAYLFWASGLIGPQ